MAKNSPTVDADGNVNKILSDTMEVGRKRAFEAIKKKALLVTLERSLFTNFVFDTALNDKICEKFGIADDTVLHVRKCLIHPRHMEQLMNITNDAIMLLWNLTRPWDNSDFRILPMEMYDDFQLTFQKLKDDFEDVRETFKTNWPDYVKEAKTTLGKAFNKDDYPEQSELDSIFVLNVVTRELNDPDDLRLNLTEQELIDLEADAGSKYKDSVSQVQDQVVFTLKTLTHDILCDKGVDKSVKKLVAPLASLANMVDADGSNSELTQAVMEFKDVLSSDFDNVDDLTMSADERETKEFENMSEEDMMMSVEDDIDVDDDDIDNW